MELARYRRAVADVLPGLALVAVGTAAAYAIGAAVPGLNPSTAGVLFGALVANLGLHRPVLVPGTAFAAKRLLRVAIVLLGLQVSLRQLSQIGAPGLGVVVVTVTVTFFGTHLLGRWLGVPPARRLLVATGFAICGASAVAAMRPVSGGNDEDTAVAVALVTLCGSLAILVLPPLRVPLGLEPGLFGAWVGASVHDVGQTVATANRVPGALTNAVVVKLTRVVLLAPLVAGVGLHRRHSEAVSAGHRPAVVPLFVAGFLLAIALTSTGIVPSGVLQAAKTAQGVLLTAALVGLGTGITAKVLKHAGGRALGLGLASWVLVAAVAYLGVRVAG